MSNQQQLIGLVRRHVKESWTREQRLLSRQSADYLQRRAEYDGALKALALLDAAAYTRDAVQEILIGEPS